MNEVEALDESRRRVLWLSLVGFALWQGLDLAGAVLELSGGSSTLRHLAQGVGLVVWALWSAALIWMSRIRRRMRAQSSVAAALDDELVRHARLRSFATAFWATMGTQVIVLLANSFHPLPAALAVQLTILVGVTVGLGAFLRARGTPEHA
ncbi:hypothetical protein [Vulgatibacter sp.]|uniref:hypothetical protein n=1 Tax=Vulgatibacter sp. TaxID=1971226 RepID=UPI00356200A1